MATLAGFSRLFNYAASACLKRSSPVSFCKQYYPALRLWENGAGYRTKVKKYYKVPWLSEAPQCEIVPEYEPEKEKIASDVIKEINTQVANKSTGRLFAVIHLCGTQFKVTENDIIIISGLWPPQPGDQLKLEKVLLVGGTDFTLVGRPILNRELVSVDATVIQKTLSHTITRYRKRKRKQFRRINFYRISRTMLRINAIEIHGDVEKKKEVEGLDRIY